MSIIVNFVAAFVMPSNYNKICLKKWSPLWFIRQIQSNKYAHSKTTHAQFQTVKWVNLFKTAKVPFFSEITTFSDICIASLVGYWWS